MTREFKKFPARKPLIEDNVTLPTQADNKKMAIMTTLPLVIWFYKKVTPPPISPRDLIHSIVTIDNSTVL